MASYMFVYFIVMKLADEIYILFQWRPLYYMKIQKSFVPWLVYDMDQTEVTKDSGSAIK